MTIKDFDKATYLCETYKELYGGNNGFISATDYIHITFDAFVDFFSNDNYIITEINGDTYGWKLLSKYDEIPVMCLATYSNMLKCDKTKQYLKEKMNA